MKRTQKTQVDHAALQVLMMVFDILASHHKMTMWHDASLDQQMAALAKLRDAKRACHARLRTQHSLKKRLSFDAVMGMPGPESTVPPQDLISSAVRPDAMLHSISRSELMLASQPYVDMHVGPTSQLCSMSMQSLLQVDGVRSDSAGVASAVPQVIRRQSRGSQALQLARSLGSAGAFITIVRFLIWSVSP